MRISFASQEVQAGVSLTSTVVAILPSSVRKDIQKKLFDVEMDLDRIYKTDVEYQIDMVSEFNAKWSRDLGPGIRFFMTHDERELLIDIDPDMVADIIHIVESEMGTLGGLAVAAWGMMMTFGSSLMRMGKKIGERVKQADQRGPKNVGDDSHIDQSL